MRERTIRIALRGMGLAAALIAAIGFAAPASASGCGIGRNAGSLMVPVRSEGRARPVLVHVPRGYEAATPAPLVINLHGSTSTGAAQFRESGLAATADRHGFLVASPDAGIAEGKGFVWNIPGVPTVSGEIPGPEDADDVRYIADLIDTLAAELCVDTGRVYLTGLSGGGRMTSWLGCVLAERIAAIAPVVGLRAGNPDPDDPARPDPRSCTPSLPMPVMAFAGAKDGVNPITGGGAGYWRYTMHAAEQRWAALNRCEAAPTAEWVDHDTYVERYGDCAGGAEVIGRIDVEGGHSWAVADNEAMWRFFARHRR